MSLQDLAKKIIDEAEVQAKNITSSSQDEIAKLKKAADEELRALSASHEAKLSRTLALNKERVLAEAEQEIQSFRDAEKRAILDEVYEKALAQIQDDEDVLEKIFSPHIKTLKGEDGIVHVAPAHEKTIKKLAKKFDAHFSVESDKKITGGFLFEGKKTEYDATLTTLIARAKDKIEPEIAEILFS